MKRSRWKVALGFLGAIALVLGLFTLWIWRTADRKWVEMVARVEQLKQEHLARGLSWTPLRGEVIPGNAWDDYGPASESVRSAPTTVLGEFVVRGKKADRAQTETALAAYGAALEALRKGARRPSAQASYDWASDEVKGLLTHQKLANLAVCRSRFLREEGKSREAAELMIDVVRYGEVVGDNAPLISEMIGIAILSMAFDELKEILEEKRLTAAEAAAVSRELEILDHTYLRHAASLRNEALYAGSQYLRQGSREWFGARLLYVHAFLELDRYLVEAAEVQEKGWADVQLALARIQAEAKSSKNPLVRMTVPGILSSARVGRERRAQMRLLRAALHFVATGEVLELDDPFGGKLLNSLSGGTLKVWSVGRDGKDDGGAGAWRPDKSGDIVLEVAR